MSQLQTIGKHATSVLCTNGLISVIYHSTLVVEADKNKGTIKLDSGGWLTVTTKARMNQASNQFDLHYSVYQRKGVWYVKWQGKELSFYDGMYLSTKEIPF
jgi:hypothetical protein